MEAPSSHKTKSKEKAKAISINRNVIPSISLNETFGNTANELDELGLKAYNANQIEESVREQVDKQLATVPTPTALEELRQEIDELESAKENADQNVKTRLTKILRAKVCRTFFLRQETKITTDGEGGGS